MDTTYTEVDYKNVLGYTSLNMILETVKMNPLQMTNWEVPV